MNAYAKLRPKTDIERCECPEIRGLLLVYLCNCNPINCSICRKEIDPERLSLDASEVDEIARCFRVFESLYTLWLNSGEYEAFAKEKLIDPDGQVNREGVAIAQKLSKKWPTFYWWFSDSDDGTPECCPSCGGDLDMTIKWGTGSCLRCRLHV